MSPRIVVVALLLLAACNEVTVPTLQVELAPFVVQVETRGELAAVQTRTISRPTTGGRQSAIVQLVAEGTTVAEGDFLCQFDPAEAERELNTKQAAHENSRAQLTATRAQAATKVAELKSALLGQRYSHEQAQLRFAQMQYEAEARRREQELELRKSELSLTEASDRIQSNRTVAAANLRKAEIEVEQAQTDVERAEKALADQTVTAPIGGLVVYMSMWKGNGWGKIAIGDTPWPGQELIEIPDLSQMMVRTKVEEVDVHRVAIGLPATLTIDALDGLEIQGEVSRVATIASRERGETAKHFDIEIVLKDNDERLRPGMSVRCKIEVEHHDDALSVPLEAVFETETSTIVWIMDGAPAERVVQLGARNGERVRIVDGLQAGETIALRDPTQDLPEVGDDLPGQSDSNGQGR